MPKRRVCNSTSYARRRVQPQRNEIPLLRTGRGRIDFSHPLITKPLKEDGTYEDDSYFSEYNFERADPTLVEVVEELGAEANGFAAELEVVEIPGGIQWDIDDYDGIETVHEQHRSW